jgi:hypothetical protein
MTPAVGAREVGVFRRFGGKWVGMGGDADDELLLLYDETFRESARPRTRARWESKLTIVPSPTQIRISAVNV